MVGVAIAINADAGSPAYAAGAWRQAAAVALQYDGRAVGGRQGVRPGGDQLLVSLAGSTITVAPGVAVLDPGLTTTQGPYWVAIPVAEAHTLDPADATNPRKDIIILRVYDHDEDLSGQRLVQTEYLVGVPNPVPAETAVPAGAMRLATVDVPQVGGGDPVVTDRRPWTVAAGGILPVAAPGDIPVDQAGRYRHRLDTGALEVDTGSQWLPVADPKRYARSGLILGQSPGQSIPNAADTDISWTLIHENEGFTFTPPHTDIVLPEDGLYIITATTLWTSNATGERRIGLLVDGALWADTGVPAVSGNVTRTNVSLVAPFNAGQVIRAPVRQSSGAPLSIQTTSRLPNISVWRVA